MKKELTEKQQSAMEKADMMLKFLRENRPETPFKFNHCMTIYDWVRYVNLAEEHLYALEPLSKHWKIIYMRLYSAKQTIMGIETNQTKAI